jgi:hypothetical protein
MDHHLLDQLKQLRVVIWKLRRHEAINVLWRAQLGMRLQEDNDVGMREATLLKLNGVQKCIDITKGSICDVLYEGQELEFEDADDQVRTIRSRLTLIEG